MSAKPAQVEEEPGPSGQNPLNPLHLLDNRVKKTT